MNQRLIPPRERVRKLRRFKAQKERQARVRALPGLIQKIRTSYHTSRVHTTHTSSARSHTKSLITRCQLEPPFNLSPIR